MKKIFFILSLMSAYNLMAQKDSVLLQPMLVRAYRFTPFVDTLPTLHGTVLTSGKKYEQIVLSKLNTVLSDKVGRQVFAKIPGLFVYDMDGTSHQMNIAARGLDPHRSWEFNVRQNGIMTNSDIYGYPASHYSAPLESIAKIEVLRGTSALQYGAGFGGMLNYVTKTADTTQRLGLESIYSVGSFQTLSSYNAVGGRLGRLTYYAYMHYRTANGYRDNAASRSQAQFIHIDYKLSATLKLTLELGRSKYLFQSPGPLTDSMFRTQPRAATRGRNYFSPDIYVPSVTLEWHKDTSTTFKAVFSLLTGTRSSVQFIGLATLKDTISAQTNQYKNRQVDIDRFQSFTSEWRFAKKYTFLKKHQILSVGYVLSNNDLHRRQLGRGTTGTDYDLTINGDWGRNMHFLTLNHAFFAENLLWLTPKWSVTPGLRIENGTTRPTGTIAYLTNDRMPDQIPHQFTLLGVNTAYQSGQWKWYGGICQAYRPITFAEIIPTNVLDSADNHLKDARGYNLDGGVQGRWRHWSIDLTAFQLNYGNRMGVLALEQRTQPPLFLRTNIGDSRTRGIELLVEYNTVFNVKQHKISLMAFSSGSYLNAVYTRGQVAVGTANRSIVGNRVESVPLWQVRNSLTLASETWALTVLHSFVGATFSDALNTGIPVASGANGLVPAYNLVDMNVSWAVGPTLNVKLGVLNLTNANYFTKRPAGYPGQGVWPSDGRSFNLSLAWRLAAL